MVSKALGRDDVHTLVLHVLPGEPNHGYAIAQAVERESSEMPRPGEGTRYPVRRLLEHNALVVSGWQILDWGPALNVYRITAAGQAERAWRVRGWRSRVSAIGAVLSADDLGSACLGHA